jgi:hypothetical protein
VGVETLIIIMARAMMAWVDRKEGGSSMPADVAAMLGTDSNNNLAVGKVVDLNNARQQLQLLILLILHLAEEVWLEISVGDRALCLGMSLQRCSSCCNYQSLEGNNAWVACSYDY